MPRGARRNGVAASELQELRVVFEAWSDCTWSSELRSVVPAMSHEGFALELANLRHDRRLHFISNLTRNAQHALIQSLAAATEKRTVFLLMKAESKVNQMARRNRKNSNKHLKGLNASKRRVGCGKNGFVDNLDAQCSYRSSFVDSDEEQPFRRTTCQTPRIWSQPVRSFCKATPKKTRTATPKKSRTALRSKGTKAASTPYTRSARTTAASIPYMPGFLAMRSSEVCLVHPDKSLQTVPDSPELTAIQRLSNVQQDTSGPAVLRSVHASDAVAEVAVTLPNGTVLLDNVGFSLDEPISSIQRRISDALGVSQTLVCPSGFVLQAGAQQHESGITAEDAGLQDGDILTAVVPVMTMARQNQLTTQERIENDISKLIPLVNDECYFRRIAHRQFRLVCNQRASRTPCTDLVRKFCDRLSLPEVDQRRLLGMMEASGQGWYTLDEENFIRFLRAVTRSALTRLERDLNHVACGCPSIPRLHQEHDLRNRLRECEKEKGFLVLGQNPPYARTGRRVRIRLSRSDASCQCFIWPFGAHYAGTRLTLGDGCFKIQGVFVVFDWKRCGSCPLEFASRVTHRRAPPLVTTYETQVRRGGLWTENPEISTALPSRVQFNTSSSWERFFEIGASSVSPAERDEVATGLRSLCFQHCDAGGF